MDTQTRYLRIRRQDIAYFKFIIESYEGMAVVRTKDPHEAVVELMVAPGWEKDIDEVLEGLRKEIPIELLPAPRKVPFFRMGYRSAYKYLSQRSPHVLAWGAGFTDD